MKKTISCVIPFLFMFMLATGSVVLSCATGPASKPLAEDAKISVNTARTPDGKSYTTWVFDSIQSVMIVDTNDRSQKIELSPKEWQYDTLTTELTLMKAIPFKDYIASIEGKQALPHQFVLNGIKDKTALLVIICDRLAIEGYDYDFNADNNRLTFRKDVKLKDADWSIEYSTQYGGTMLGEWKPENDDRLSYLEAEHQKRWLDSWYDRQTAFWFLDDTRSDAWKANRERPPELIHRAATAKELADMKAEPMNVVKFRTDTKDKDVTRELGFDSFVPKKLVMESPREEFPLFCRTIEEYSNNGMLAMKLHVVYDDASGKVLGQYVMDITMEKSGNEPGSDASNAKKNVWLINEETQDLGLPVRVVRRWGLKTSDMEAMPTVTAFTTWTWSDKTVRYQADGESANDVRSTELIRQFIAVRLKEK